MSSVYWLSLLEHFKLSVLSRYHKIPPDTVRCHGTWRLKASSLETLIPSQRATQASLEARTERILQKQIYCGYPSPTKSEKNKIHLGDFGTFPKRKHGNYYVPGTQTTSIFKGQPPKTRPNIQSKQGAPFGFQVFIYFLTFIGGPGKPQRKHHFSMCGYMLTLSNALTLNRWRNTSSCSKGLLGIKFGVHSAKCLSLQSHTTNWACVPFYNISIIFVHFVKFCQFTFSRCFLDHHRKQTCSSFVWSPYYVHWSLINYYADLKMPFSKISTLWVKSEEQKLQSASLHTSAPSDNGTRPVRSVSGHDLRDGDEEKSPEQRTQIKYSTTVQSWFLWESSLSRI